MIISKTPLRISFFGGGTDYPIWFRNYGGEVLGTTIDKFSYLTCRYLPPFFSHKYRIVYSKMEKVKDVNDIDHPSVRNCIKHCDLKLGLEIHHDADLPARSGLGSSSTFTVGMLNCFFSLKGENASRKKLASQAILVEQEKIGENVGSQDQVHAAYGGFNHIEFFQNGRFKVNPINMNNNFIKILQDHCLLFYTGISRFASNIASSQIKNTPKKKHELNAMKGYVKDALNIIDSRRENIEDFGRLLDENWKLKKSLSKTISNSSIDQIYSDVISAGAYGGKLLGAGGGGFILFIAKPELHKIIKEKLRKLLHVDFAFSDGGSKIIFNQE